MPGILDKSSNAVRTVLPLKQATACIASEIERETFPSA